MNTKIKVIHKDGEKPIHFKEGTLHSQLGVSQSEKIPASKMRAALSGQDGSLAKKRANFARNVLTGKK